MCCTVKIEEKGKKQHPWMYITSGSNTHTVEYIKTKYKNGFIIEIEVEIS